MNLQIVQIMYIFLSYLPDISYQECWTEENKYLKIYCANSSIDTISREVIYSYASLEDHQHPIIYNLNITNSNFTKLTYFPNPLLGSLKELLLINCSIEYVEETVFKQFTDLTILSLSHNQIENISFVKFITHNLNELYLNHNLIRSVNSTDFMNLSELSYLDLSNCRITGIFSFSFRQTQMFIDIENNFVESLEISEFGHGFYPNMYPNINVANNSIKNCYSNRWAYLLNMSRNSINSFHKNCKIYNINLSNSNLTNIRNIHFNNYYNYFYLHHLDLSNNQIDTIPNAFPFCRIYFTSLIIAKNRIRNIEIGAFNGCTEMKMLDLSHNELSFIDESIFQPLNNIESIDISYNAFKNIRCNIVLKIPLQLSIQYNCLTSVDSIIINSNYLEPSKLSLSLAGNNITLKSTVNNSLLHALDLSETHIQEVPSYSFKYLPSIVVLSLKNNNINVIESDAFVLLKKLETLNLEGNPIKKFSPQAFYYDNILNTLYVSFLELSYPNVFTNLYLLQTLSISGINSNAYELEASFFKGLCHLNELILSNITIQSVQPGAFTDFFSLHSINLQQLFANMNSIKTAHFFGLSNISSLDLSNLSISTLENHSFLGMKKLQSLLLNDNNIKIIANNTFDGLSKLLHLNLSHNQISEMQQRSFFGLNNLETLRLDGNNLSVLQIGGFQFLPNLKELYLQRNQLRKIKTGFFSNLQQLKSLDLSYNNIFILRIEALLSLKQLENLYLNSNALIQQDNELLVKSLKKLKFINLNNNKWRCEKLALMLMDFGKHNILSYSTVDAIFDDTNIDGIHCNDICNYLYCDETEEHY